VNHEIPFLPSTVDLLKWQLGPKPLKKAKKRDTERLEVLDPEEFLASDADGILWLGHASVYVRIGGRTALIDPVFGDPPLIRAFVEVPDPIEKIRRLDYILLSHDHRDHCDEGTLRKLAKRFPEAKFLAGLGMEGLLGEWKQPGNPVETAGWFQQYETEETMKIAFVPVRHWCRRGLSDTNKRLWGGFVIEGGGKKIYFGGDSGYGRHYRETGEVFPEIDYFIIGIGSYEPRWFMEPNHNNPAEAVKAFADAEARYLVPMHYGTFDLSDEPPSEPLRLLREEAAALGFADRIKAPTINESVLFE
jgi:L-ascorbate metabolism protein UlaG (beta-lactamase superfamily)